MSSNYGFQPTLSGLNTIESDSTTSANIDCDTIQINQSGTAPTMTSGDNSTHIATTAFVQNAISTTGTNYVTLSGTQTITGQKTIQDTYMQFKSSFVPSQNGRISYDGLNQWVSVTSTNNFAIQAGGGTTYSNGNGIFNIKSNTLGTNTKLYLNDNYDNALMLFDCSATGVNTINSYKPLTISASSTTLNTMKGQYIDLFAGQLRMFSGSTGGSAVYFYVPPSGRSIMDFSTTNADMVGQYNLTSNNMTCSVAPTTGNEYCNKTYVDSVAGGGGLLSSNNTWTGSNTFNNFAVSQTTGDVSFGLASTNSLKLYVNGLPTRSFYLNFLAGQYPCIQNTTTDPVYILAGNGTGGSASMYLQANFWGVGTGGINLGSRTNCQLGLDVNGDLKTNNLTTKSDPNSIINLNSPLLPSYNPSVLNFVDNIGSQINKSYTTPSPVVGAIKTISTEFLPVGVYICEFYAGWAQASNNRAISISTNSTILDNSRACYSTQQNTSYQELNLTTVIQNTVSTTPYYLQVQCGANAGGFSSVQYYFRATRIA